MHTNALKPPCTLSAQPYSHHRKQMIIVDLEYRHIAKSSVHKADTELRVCKPINLYSLSWSVRVVIIRYDLKICDDGKLVQLLRSWTLSIVSPFL
jgi:hypothetical protein